MAGEIDNLGIQQQLNKLFADRIPLLTKSTQEMQSQLKIAVQLRAVMDNLSSGELTDKLNEASKALEDVANKAEQTGGITSEALKSMSNGADKAGGNMVSLSKLTEAAGKSGNKSFMLLARAMNGAVATGKALISVGKGVLSFFFNVGKAVAAIPLRLFRSLLTDAAEFVGDPALMQAIEDIRKEFGDLRTGTSKDILAGAASVSAGLEKTGLSVYQVFESPAEKLKYMTELFKGAGSQALQFGSEIAQSGGIIAAFDKGMGIGAENLKGFMNRATILGTDLQEQLRTTANYSLQLGQAFGVSQKILSKDVGSMMKDVKNFGSLTQKQMVVSTIYTRKLGLETKDLLNLIDKFDNFEDAANSAAMLSQAFGANVDAFKLMNEQDPAKRLDDLRKSMQATGKSTENMTRQELKLLAQTSGLSEEAAKLAFSTKNQGLSYDQIQKQANKAENAQLKQTEALEKLASSIERVVRSGQTMQGSFFGQFTAGMEAGVKTSKPYIGMMKNLHSGLLQTFQAGRKVGNMFATSENLGIGKFFSSVSNFFDPSRISFLLNGFNKNTKKGVEHTDGIIDSFKKLFDGSINVSQFFGKIKNIGKLFFLDAFAGNTEAEAKASAIKFVKRVAKGLGEFAVYAIHELTKSFKMIADFIRNPKEFLDKIKAGAKDANSVGGSIVASFSEAFKDKNMLRDLWGSIKDLVGLIAGKVIHFVKTDPKIKEVGGALGMAMLGPKAIGPIFSVGGALLKGAGSLIGPAFGIIAGIGAGALATTGINKGIKKYTNDLIKDGLNPAQAKIGAAAAGVVDALSFGLLPEGSSVKIGKSISKLSDMILDKIKNTFGQGFSETLKKQLSREIDFLGSIGDALSAIFSGDSEKMVSAFVALGKNMVKFLFGAIAVIIDSVPRLMMKVSEVAWKIPEMFFRTISDGFIKEGNEKGGFFGGVLKGFGFIIKQAEAFFLLITSSIKSLQVVWDYKNKLFTLDKEGIKEGASKIGNIFHSNFDKFRSSFFGKKENKVENQEVTVPEPTDVGVKVADSMKQNVEELSERKKTLEESIKSLQDVANSDSINKAGVVITNLEKSLDEFNKKFSVTGIGNTLEVTQQIARTVNELNEALGQTGANAMTMTTKLQKFADNSGLGKSGTYEIKNKGIVLKLDLKVVMDAGDVEKAIVLRKDSIIFDALEDMPSLNINNPEYKSGFDKLRQQKGGG